MVPPARTENEPNMSDIGNNSAQIKDAHAVKIRFGLVFCNVLPELYRHGWPKSMSHHHVVHYTMHAMRLSESLISSPYVYASDFGRHPAAYHAMWLDVVVQQCGISATLLCL